MHGIIFTGFAGHSSFKASYKRTGGAHRIATYLREKGWDIEVLDFVMGWNFEQLVQFTQSRITHKTIWLGFGGTFPIWSGTMQRFFNWFRSTYPHIKIICGGQVANIHKIEADWYVTGFGEKAIDALLKHIVGNSSLKYKTYKNGRKIVDGNHDYPSFPMKDLHISYEDRDFILPNETLVTELGRGCIFKCSFCNFPVLGVKEDHSRSAENLKKELQENYDRWGVTKYVIADETVNDYSQKLEKFAKIIKTLNFKPRMFGYARADLLVSRKQDWDTMIEMGFTGHHYGIESTNPQSLKSIGKGMHPDKLLPGLLEARKYFKDNANYKGQVSLIAGLPFETPETFSKGVKWFNENWKTENVMMFPFYIPKANSLDTLSSMSVDHTKYGYRETEEDLYIKIKELYRSIPAQYGMGDGLNETTGLSWENDHWNIFDVSKAVVDFYTDKNYTKTYGPLLWHVGEYELTFNKDFDWLNDKTLSDLNVTGYAGIIKLIQSSNRLINDYIEKKLNWRASK